MSRLLASCAAIILAFSCSQAFAQEGGYKDPTTGKVWSYQINTVAGDWISHNNYLAAEYGVWDLNSQGVMTYYDDWRLPTVAEMQAAITNGTIQWVNQNSAQMIRNREGWFWTSTLSGKRPYYVVVKFGANGEVIQSGSGAAVKVNTNFGATWGLWSFMIRP